MEEYLEELKRRFEEINPSDYYLSYSGGKDSHFLFWFIKEYLKDTEIEIVGVNTRLEHPEILHRIETNCDVVLLPKLTPQEIKEQHGIPCFSKFQDEMINRYQRGSRTKNTMDAITGENRVIYKINKTAKELTLSGELHKVSNKCCKFLKKDSLREYEKQSKRKAILGVRSAESALRKNKYTTYFTKDMKFTPIYDLPDELQNEIYKKYNIEIPSVYTVLNRTGCMGCPYGAKKGNTEKELSLLDEVQRKEICSLFKESYDVLGVDYE